MCHFLQSFACILCNSLQYSLPRRSHPRGAKEETTMAQQAVEPTVEHAKRILELVDHGLTNGLGKQEPGGMCIEAVVNYAFGRPHGDDPPCVGASVRSFKIRLNDSCWSSDQERAKGMRRVERDRLQERLERISKYCADETDGDSPIRDGLLASIGRLADGLAP